MSNSVRGCLSMFTSGGVGAIIGGYIGANATDYDPHTH